MKVRLITYDCSACSKRTVGFIRGIDHDGQGYDVFLLTNLECCEFAWFYEVIKIVDCSDNRYMKALYKIKMKEHKKLYE